MNLFMKKIFIRRSEIYKNKNKKKNWAQELIILA